MQYWWANCVDADARIARYSQGVHFLLGERSLRPSPWLGDDLAIGADDRTDWSTAPPMSRLHAAARLSTTRRLFP